MGGAATAVGLAGCTGNGGNDTTTTGTTSTTTATETTTQQETAGQQQNAGSTGGTLNLINSSITTLDPIAATDEASLWVILQLFDTLVDYPNGETTVGKLLATDYKVEGGTKYTFTLAKDVAFHNGHTLTARDFVYSWERLAQSKNSRRADYLLTNAGVKHKTDGKGNYVPNSLGVSAPDDQTFVVELEKPYHATLDIFAYASFAAIPNGLVGDIEGVSGKLSQKEFSTKKPIGTGPFTFKKWTSNTEAAVTKFDNYHGEGPKLDGVHWQIIEDDNAHWNYTMNKNADIFGIPTAHYSVSKLHVKNTDQKQRESGTYGPVRNGSTLNYKGVPTVTTYYIGFDTDNVEKPVRQAFAYAFDQNTVVKQILKGRGNPAYMLTPPNIWPGGAKAYDTFAKQNYPYGYAKSDLEKAKGVMEQAGYGPNNKYDLEFTLYKGSTVWQQTAQMLRDQLTPAHINITITVAPFSTMLKRGRNNKLQVYSLGWGMDWPTPDDFLQLIYPPNTSTKKSGPLSYTNWKGTDAAKKATTAWKKVQSNLGTSDAAQQARNEAYKTMEQANWEDVVLLNFYNPIRQWFSYDWVNYPTFGGAGFTSMKQNHTTKSRSQ